MRKEQKSFVAWHHGMAPHGVNIYGTVECLYWDKVLPGRHGPPPRMCRVKTIVIKELDFAFYY